ncbi:YdiU family protein [Rhodococcus aerolatus]
MTVEATPTVSLSHQFVDVLPEMARPGHGADTPAPQLVVLNEALAAELGLDADWLRSPAGVGLLTGTVVPEGAHPVAQQYAGHQFAHFNPRMGDGRALLMGELTDTAGRLRDLHLKGSGPTMFARAGDGLAALGPMLREHVVSEGMHALGIPTTRSLAVTATGRAVLREDGPLPGAVLARVAASHLRVGSLQHAAATGDLGLLRRVADHAIARHHPRAASAPNPYLALYEAVVAAQASLVARWMGVGFVHGVQNTDNVTLSGETIDYGPCAFLEAYDPAASFSSIDQQHRYAYGNQPGIAQWNLTRLAEALLPLIDDDQEQAVAQATAVLRTFASRYEAARLRIFTAKLGLTDEATAGPLLVELLPQLQASHVDHTGFWRALAGAARGDAEDVRGRFVDLATVDAWLDRWRAAGPDADAMDRVNPVYIPRNHLVEEALAAAQAGDLAPLHGLLDALGDPFTVRPGLERYAEAAPVDFGVYRTFCGT